MAELEQALAALLPEFSAIVASRPIGGGCISQAQQVSVIDTSGALRQWFVKSNEVSFLDNFQCEWQGLMRLREADAIGVPQPIAVDVVGDRAYLITAWIDPQRRPGDFMADLGRSLAALHRATLGQRIGFDRDNYLGAAKQVNEPGESWPEFVAEHRIGYQLRWAVDQQRADARLRRDCQRIIDTMESLLAGRDETTSLLHGDLWSGNYLCGPDGRPFLIDPAVYYGCREAEFGMLKLFGACDDRFYQAYVETFPLPDHWERRVEVYVLYHLLNHLNLFGSSYLDQCRSVAAAIA